MHGTQEPHESPYPLAFGHGPTFKWAMWLLKPTAVGGGQPPTPSPKGQGRPGLARGGPGQA
jgi:hypothetical protein